MGGNAWEWCWDWYGSYGSSAQTDPVGPTSALHRLGRGGGWDDNADNPRTAHRYNYASSSKDNRFGFRLVRSGAAVTGSAASVNTTLAAQGLSMRVVHIIGTGATDTYRGMTLTSYALSETEVTQGDYETVMGSNPASGYGAGSNYPVYYVSWYDAVRFANALSTLCDLQPVYNETTWAADFTENGFYLPTDAQWEYAAGGPNHYIWPLGDTFDASDYVYGGMHLTPVHATSGVLGLVHAHA